MGLALRVSPSCRSATSDLAGCFKAPKCPQPLEATGFQLFFLLSSNLWTLSRGSHRTCSRGRWVLSHFDARQARQEVCVFLQLVKSNIITILQLVKLVKKFVGF